MITVNQMLTESQGNNQPLLSSYSGSWWSEYITNYSALDYMFTNKFKNFWYWDQDTDEDEDADVVQARFTAMVQKFLLMNDKKYSELYRIHVIPDDDNYSLTNNYDRHETYSGSASNNGSVITGQRTDITYDNIGSQKTDNLNKVTGYNDASENSNDSTASEIGTREDTHQFTKGQETDTNRSQGSDSHTSRIYGNIGVTTVDDMLKKHIDLWKVFSFYEIVFDDICKEFLLGGGSIWL